MRSWLLSACCVVMFVAGCTRQLETGFRAGDVSQPEVLYAPDGPWTAGTSVSIGMLVKLQRSGGGSIYLADADVVLEEVTMKAKITFFDGRRMMGEPLEVPFIHDC